MEDRSSSNNNSRSMNTSIASFRAKRSSQPITRWRSHSYSRSRAGSEASKQ
jgi:hypothetical protein